MQRAIFRCFRFIVRVKYIKRKENCDSNIVHFMLMMVFSSNERKFANQQNHNVETLLPLSLFKNVEITVYSCKGEKTEQGEGKDSEAMLSLGKNSGKEINTFNTI